MRSYNQKTGGLESGPREQPAGGRCGGFTLIELLSALAIIAVLIGLLLPAIQKAREEYAKNMAADNLRALLTASNDYLGSTGSYPASLTDLTPFCSANPASCQFDQQLLRGSAGGYNFLLGDGSVRFLIEAEPQSPGITGSQTLTIDQGGLITEAPTPGSDEARQQAFDNILASGANTAAALLSLDSTGAATSEVRGYTGATTVNTGTLNIVFDTLDTGGDDRVSLREINTFTDTAFDDEAVSGPLEQFVDQVQQELKLGDLSDQDLESIAVGVTDLDTTQPLLYSYDALKDVTTIFMDGASNTTMLSQMLAKLDEAEAAEASGDLRGEARALKQYKKKVKSERGKSLTGTESKTLIALSDCLAAN